MPPSASPCLLVLLAAACGSDPGYAPEARDTTVPADASPDTSPTGDVAALADDAAASAAGSARVNVLLGRRFRLVSFRWLQAKEL